MGAVCGIVTSNTTSIRVSPSQMMTSHRVKETGTPIDPWKCGSLMLVKDKEGRRVFMRKEELHFSDRIKDIQARFYLTENKEEIVTLWDSFKKLDKRKAGYLVLEQLYELLQEDSSSSVVCPVMDRLFVLIEKEFSDKVSFEELLPNLISYCNLSSFQLIEFVFHMLDIDHNNYISRAEIVKLVSIQREGEQIYFLNHKHAIENYSLLSRSDKISLEEFVEVCQRLPFIYFPAVQLQKSLCTYFVNSRFWTKLQKTITENYMKNIKSSENERIDKRIEEIKNNVLQKKIDNFSKNRKGQEAKIYEEEVRLQRKLSDTCFFLEKNKKGHKRRQQLYRGVRMADSMSNVSIHFEPKIV